MWHLPGSGIKPLPPVLAGRFSTTEPPEKPYRVIFLFLVMRTLVYSLSNFQICNTVLLTIVTKETYQLHLWASYAKIRDVTGKESHPKSFWVDKFENPSFLNTLGQWEHSHPCLEERSFLLTRDITELSSQEGVS